MKVASVSEEVPTERICKILRQLHLQREVVVFSQGDRDYIANHVTPHGAPVAALLSSHHVMIRVLSFISPIDIIQTIFPVCRSTFALMFSPLLWRVLYVSMGPLKYSSKLQDSAALLFTPLNGTGFALQELEERERYMDLVVVLIVCGYFRCLRDSEDVHNAPGIGVLLGRDGTGMNVTPKRGGKGGKQRAADPMELFCLGVGREVAGRFSNLCVFGSFFDAVVPLWAELFAGTEPPRVARPSHATSASYSAVVGKTRCQQPPGANGSCVACDAPAVDRKSLRALLISVAHHLYQRDALPERYDFIVKKSAGCEVEVRFIKLVNPCHSGNGLQIPSISLIGTSPSMAPLSPKASAQLDRPKLSVKTTNLSFLGSPCTTPGGQNRVFPLGSGGLGTAGPDTPLSCCRSDSGGFEYGTTSWASGQTLNVTSMQQLTAGAGSVCVLRPNLMYYTKCLHLLDLLVNEGSAGPGILADFVETDILDGQASGLRKTPAERRVVTCSFCGSEVTSFEYAKSHAGSRCLNSPTNNLMSAASCLSQHTASKRDRSKSVTSQQQGGGCLGGAAVLSHSGAQHRTPLSDIPLPAACLSPLSSSSTFNNCGAALNGSGDAASVKTTGSSTPVTPHLATPRSLTSTASAQHTDAEMLRREFESQLKDRRQRFFACMLETAENDSISLSTPRLPDVNFGTSRGLNDSLGNLASQTAFLPTQPQQLPLNRSCQKATLDEPVPVVQTVRVPEASSCPPLYQSASCNARTDFLTHIKQKRKRFFSSVMN
eukprot:gene9351-14498_t